MDKVDRGILNAERDAAAHCHPRPPSHARANPRPPRRTATEQSYVPRESHEIERVSTGSSTSSLASPAATAADNLSLRTVPMSRISTQPDLERHPTELSRIATHRSQHSATVGRSKSSKPCRDPLPPFGAKKPYPPCLPAQEEYVVEFDGEDDPMHPHNWPFKRK
jgi:MFS transporter, DHA1 family, multidrug resistance protein